MMISYHAPLVNNNAEYTTMELIAIRLVKHHNNDNVTITAPFPQLVRLQVASQVRRVLAAHAQGRYCKRDILVETQYALG